jgi:collagen type VII alpha
MAKSNIGDGQKITFDDSGLTAPRVFTFPDMDATLGGKGDTGAQGVKGDTGIIGNTGSSGAKGDTGSDGAQGTHGDTGNTGSTGSQGIKGDTGSQGTHGDTGTTGNTGNTGAKGDTGIQGAKGDTGTQGSKGDTGTGGSSGAKGDTGTTGTTGNTGAKGDTGTIGNTGAKGDTGTTGSGGAKGDTGVGAGTYSRVTGSNFTTTGQALTNITGLSNALAASHTYEFEAILSTASSSTAGIEVGVQFSAAGATVECTIIGRTTASAMQSERKSALNSASGIYQTTASDGQIWIKGVIVTGVNAGNLTIQLLKVTSGTATVYINSFLRTEQIA